MSTAAGLAPRPARPSARPAAARRPALELVAPARRSVSRTPFVAVVVALLAAGLLGLLALNTVLAQDAFRLHGLKQDARTLEEREQALQREVEALRAPQALAARAGALGMVQAGPPAFLRLPDGKVLGAATAAQAPAPPAPKPVATPKVPTAKAKAKAKARAKADPARTPAATSRTPDPVEADR